MSVEDWAEIRRLHRAEGLPIKLIARTLGISRNTVRAAVASEGPPRYVRKPAGSAVDGFEDAIRAQLTAVPSAKVKPFRVKEARAHIECEVKQIITDHNTNIILGRIVHTHVTPGVWKNGRIDPRLLDPVCRLSGSGYAQLGELINVQRQSWTDIKNTNGKSAMAKAVKR